MAEGERDTSSAICSTGVRLLLCMTSSILMSNSSNFTYIAAGHHSHNKFCVIAAPKYHSLPYLSSRKGYSFNNALNVSPGSNLRPAFRRIVNDSCVSLSVEVEKWSVASSPSFYC